MGHGVTEWTSPLSALSWHSTAVAQPTGGRGPGPPPKPHNKIFTDYDKYETCPIKESEVHNRICLRVRVTRGCDFGAKCTRNCLAAGLRPDPLGELTALPQTP